MHSVVEEPLGISTASETALVFPLWVPTVFSEGLLKTSPVTGRLYRPLLFFGENVQNVDT